MYRQMLARSSLRQAVAWTALATAGTYTLMPSRTLRLEGDQNSLLDTVKEKAHEAKEGLQARNPLKPESPAGIAGAKTSVNPNTSMNHGQASFGETAAPHDVGVVAAAEKKRQAASGNPTTNEHTGEAKQGGGAGAKIASGHAEDGTPNAELGEKKKKKKKGKKSKKAKQEGEETPASPTGEAARATAATGAGLTAGVGQGFQEKEEEASQEQAFDEETGEINWDCPCLGGMAHGPCGEKFKAAFSCFVYSKEEPKGKECLDKFRGMQECFKEHPEVYGSLVDDDETTEGKMVETEASS